MAIRRWLLVGLLVLVAGCESGGKGSPEPAPTDPLAQVRAAAAKTAGVPAHVTLSAPNVEVAGDTDPAGRALTLSVTTGTGGEAVESRVRVVGDDAWMTLGSTYMPNLDPTKFIWFPTAEFASASVVHLGDAFDPAGIRGFAAAMTAATRTGEGTYSGKLDFGVAPAGVSRGLLPAKAESLERHGGVSQSVPYEASVDAHGYLTSLTVSLPTFATTATFSDFAKPVTIGKPSDAEIIEVPDALRRLMSR
ncbi:hypothetical protein [Micromonospora sp. MH99]|uniref:hypothetical protein n=1 Tax=Micromonospora sp. MH99 TaxID=1945510 RepID=UPI001F358BC5|nr:hypothetical protein [Micromonospora sp. MH99]MCF0093761.1 hypothetical protein [Micromonospora sp. MH99]